MSGPPSNKRPFRAHVQAHASAAKPAEPAASGAASRFARLRGETRKLIAECRASVADFHAVQEQTRATVDHLRAELDAAADARGALRRR